MTVRDDRGDVKQTTTGFRGPLMVQSLTSAKSKFLSLRQEFFIHEIVVLSFFVPLRREPQHHKGMSLLGDSLSLA